jgi:hypothetical protein
LGTGWEYAGVPVLLVGRRKPATPLRPVGSVAVGREGYLDGIDTAEIIDTVHSRRPPMIFASAGLRV